MEKYGSITVDFGSQKSLAQELASENAKLRADAKDFEDALKRHEAYGPTSVAKAAESNWKDVVGTADKHGLLQAFCIGRSDRPGSVLRFVHGNGRVSGLFTASDIKMFPAASDGVTLKTEGQASLMSLAPDFRGLISDIKAQPDWRSLADSLCGLL